MPREVSIPLFLWICAAICAHLAFGTGGYVVGRFHDDQTQIWELLLHSRDRTRVVRQGFEVSLVDETKPADDAQPPKDETKPETKKKDETKPEPSASVKPEAAKPPEEKKKAVAQEEKKKDEKKVLVVEKKEEEKKQQAPLEDPLKDHRIAVRQHVKPNQADNPNAHFIGDQANKVDQETVASQTTHDRDDENPTPGGNHQNADKQMGDSEKTRIAESEEHPGDKNHAPGEKGTEFDVQHDPMPQHPAPVAVQAPMAPKAPQAGGDNKPRPSDTQPAQPQLAPGGANPAAPEVENSNDGSWTFNPTRAGTGTGTATEPGPGDTKTKPVTPGQLAQPTMGLGQGTGPGQVNLNLSQQGVAAVVGQDQLRKMREADGERRKSEHRGSWTASNFERWKSAIENYVSTVKTGNQTALNTAASPFATYLNGMHNRIHPIFADGFLGSLDSLPKDHPLNDQHLVTRLEIVLTKEGHLQKMGVVKTSGVTAFDIAALDSVNRAQPFGPAPAAIISKDGNVYLHWEFHRDEVYACSTMNARPFLLNIEPKEDQPPPPPPPGNPATPKERGAPPVNTPETREGALPPLLDPLHG